MPRGQKKKRKKKSCPVIAKKVEDNREQKFSRNFRRLVERSGKIVAKENYYYFSRGAIVAIGCVGFSTPRGMGGEGRRGKERETVRNFDHVAQREISFVLLGIFLTRRAHVVVCLGGELKWIAYSMKIYYYEGEPNVSHKYSNIYIYIYLGMRYLSIFFFFLFAILLFVNCSMNKCAKMKKRIRKRRISKEKCKSIGNRMTRRYVRMGSWTFQSRTIFLGVVETYARFEARSKQNDFAGYPLTCEVKIRFSRAFHTSRTIRHPVPTTQISLVDWRFDLSQSWGINSDVNKFQLFEETKMRLAGSIAGGYRVQKL